MLHLVIKFDETAQREVGVNADGTTVQDLANATLYSDESEARAVAEKYGGHVHDEDFIFPEHYEEEDFDE